MTFAREKRLLLGLLAALAPLPLPWSDALEWPLLLAYLAAVGVFLWRVHRDADRWLPAWAMNVLGGAYLPFAWLDLTVLRQGQVLRPLLHLALFVTAVKLFALRRERDKWQILIAVFIVFLAAMGTSVHPSVVVYLLAFMALAFLLLVRFAAYHVLSAFGRTSGEAARLPLAAFVTTSMALVALASVPLFTLLPRVRTPFIVGSGTGSGTEQASTGFSDAMNLDETSRLRESGEVVARLGFLERPAAGGDELRLRTATYDLWDGHDWRRSPLAHALPRLPTSGAFDLVEAAAAPTGGPATLTGELAFTPVATPAARAVATSLANRTRRGLVTANSVRVYLRPLRSTGIPVPADALAVGLRATALAKDQGGAVLVAQRPLESIVYDIDLAAAPVLDRVIPPDAHLVPEASDVAGVTPQMRELARGAMGLGSAGQRAAALERFLIDNYTYTLDFVGRGGDQPLEDFLFRYKSGHCEYFASAMVLLLRSQGIPARLVTGFLGGEYNRLEGFYVVRQVNAHAWVEAWIEGEGWRTFDATPPDGRPGSGGEGVLQLVRQLSDYLVFRWDRYVLSYGLEDQLGLLRVLRETWSTLWGDLFGRGGPQALPASPTPTAEAAATVVASTRRLPTWLWLLLPFVTVVVASLLWLRRPLLTATRAYERLRRELGRGGLRLPSSTAPLTLATRVREHFPAADEPATRVVRRYLRESFAGEALTAAEREALVADLATAVNVVRRRKAARRAA